MRSRYARRFPRRTICCRGALAGLIGHPRGTFSVVGASAKPAPSGHKPALAAKLAWLRGGASTMTIIDSQVHAYEANTPKRPWHSVPNWPAHVTGDEMVAAMDKVGVDGAIFISAFSMYRYDGSYAVEVQRAHPDL